MLRYLTCSVLSSLVLILVPLNPISAQEEPGARSPICAELERAIEINQAAANDVFERLQTATNDLSLTYSAMAEANIWGNSELLPQLEADAAVYEAQVSGILNEMATIQETLAFNQEWLAAFNC